MSIPHKEEEQYNEKDKSTYCYCDECVIAYKKWLRLLKSYTQA